MEISITIVLLLGLLPSSVDAKTLSLPSNGDAHMKLSSADQARLDVAEAFAVGRKLLRDDLRLKQRYLKKNIDSIPGDQRTADVELAMEHSATDEVQLEENEAIISLAATLHLLGKRNVDLDALLKDNNIINAWQEIYADDSEKINCSFPDNKAMREYRTIEGACNNKNHPEWGSIFQPQSRLLTPVYDDDVNSPRQTSVNRNPLPSARLVSNLVLRNLHNLQDETRDDVEKTVMEPAWGQFVDHDVSETPMSRGEDNAVIGCCSLKSKQRNKRLQCFTIDIPVNDHKFKDCMNFVRSTATRGNKHLPGRREHFNSITPFLDASNVYGSEVHVAAELREENGLMKTADRSTLPSDNPHSCALSNSTLSHCLREGLPAHCQKAGDIRVNENPHLGAMHLAFVREHNRIALKLSEKKKHWDGDRIYQETRRIIAAIMQHISFDEWLPRVIGDEMMKKEKLDIKAKYVYDDEKNPQVFNVFAAAAMRYGHTLVTNHMNLLFEDFETELRRPIHSQFNNPGMVFEGVPKVARWIVTRPCKHADRFFVPGLQDFLFRDKNGVSFDLPALNIQRARDHGIPSYIHWRRFCDLSVPKDFDDLSDHTTDAQQALKSTYESVEDIDIFPGAISETNVKDGNVGPTFSCLLAKQFHALKFGDRFWYQNRQDPTTTFTKGQIKAIEKVKLAKILCENYQLSQIQEDVFRQHSVTNGLQNCIDMDALDLAEWED